MEKSRTANLIAIFIAAVLMVVLIVGHIRTNESQIFRMPEGGQLLTASVQGRNGPVEVEVAAGPTAFYRVKILSHEETEGIGTLAVDAIPNTIMETQRLDFDAVSGATITSEAIRSAVASALESGGIDPAAFGYVAPTPAPEKEEAPKPAPAPAAAAGGQHGGCRCPGPGCCRPCCSCGRCLRARDLYGRSDRYGHREGQRDG